MWLRVPSRHVQYTHPRHARRGDRAEVVGDGGADARQRGTLARSLLSTAIDDADPDPSNIVALLDGIDGAREDAQEGWRQAQDGDTTPLDQL